MYTVEIHCSVPADIVLTDAMRRQLHPNIPGGFRILTFDSKEELFYYVRNFDYTSSNGQQRNYFLESVMCQANDARRDKYKVPYKYKQPDTWHYFLGYYAKDENCRVIDLRHYTDELYRFDKMAYSAKERARYNEEWEEKRAVWKAEYDAKWEKLDRLLEGRPYWGFIKNPKTMNEKRMAAIPEHKLYIRGRRSKCHLPCPWADEKSLIREKTWKARTKVKRQWLVNKRTHIDTIKNVNYKRTAFDLYIEAEEEI